MRRAQTALVILTCVLVGFLPESAYALPQDGKNCYIFVHGRQETNQSYYDWNVARNYWRSSNGGTDTIGTILNSSDRRSYYVVNYNGTAAWFDSTAGGQVAWQIVNATNGGADNGGGRCAYSYAQGGRFVVIAHSMGATIMDAILGNATPGDPNYNYMGYPLSTVAQRISYVISLSGAHRGSQLADAVCQGRSSICGLIGSYWTCDAATDWLQTRDDRNVWYYSNAPARTVWLIGGYRTMWSQDFCLSGQNDGVVQYASQFACNGLATTPYGNAAYPCGNSSKQKLFGFRNWDAAYENHTGCKDCSQWSERIAIYDGSWYYGSTLVSPGTTLWGSYATCGMLREWVDKLAFP